MTVFDVWVFRSATGDYFDRKVELPEGGEDELAKRLWHAVDGGRISEFSIEPAGHEIYTIGVDDTFAAIEEHLGILGEV